MAERVLSPSDLARVRAGVRVRVAGRVLAAEGRIVRITDAFAAVDAQTRAPLDVRPGDLVILSAAHRRGRLVGARLVERLAAPPPSGSSETSRFSWHRTGRWLRARHDGLRAIRRYFLGQRFVEVDTPQRVVAPGLDVHVDALRAEGGWLVTSPEFHMKRLLVGGVPRCFQLAHCFRRDELGALHQPEFMMLEWYRAFCGVEAVMRDTERVVSLTVRAVAHRGWVESPGGKRVDVTPPYDRITVSEAFRQHAAVPDALALAERDPDRFFELLVAKVEPALATRRRAVFLHDYPISQASLARASPADPRVAERFELYVGGVELCNGFGELTDAGEQARRFRRDRAERRSERRPVYPVDRRFLAALSEGMPPAAGNALGVDRLIALAVGAKTIADVQPFPASWL